MEELALNAGKDDFIIPLGKYKGQNIVNVYEDDPDYFQWLYDNCSLDPHFSNVLENMIKYGIPF